MSRTIGERPKSQREQIPAKRRQEALDRDGHRCQLCGARGPEVGGDAMLQVHHSQEQPVEYGRHDLRNLVSLCRGCHNWTHKRPVSDALPVELCEPAKQSLLPHDFEILEIVAEHGPLSTDELTQRLTADMARLPVKERCWKLMGLTMEVSQQDHHVLDQDADTDQWGLPEQIAHSKRGAIPDNESKLFKRLQDEMVRRALAGGRSREAVAEDFGISRRATYYKQHRARAYQFSPAALSSASMRTDDGGSENGDSEDALGVSGVSETGRQSSATSQTMTLDGMLGSTDRESNSTTDAECRRETGDGDRLRAQDVDSAGSLGVDKVAVKAKLNEAIEALQAIEASLT